MLTSVGVPGAPSGKEPVIGTLTTVGQMSLPFEPVIGRPFYVSIWSNEAGPGTPAMVHLCRSFDRGQTWLIAVEEPMPLVELGGSRRFTSYEQGLIYAVKLVTLSSISSLYYRLSQ